MGEAANEIKAEAELLTMMKGKQGLEDLRTENRVVTESGGDCVT